MALLSVKVFYVENKSTKEIRKFSVDGDVYENFEYLMAKIRQVFPDLLRKDLELFWKDDEEDYISISSNEELIQAIHALPERASCLKLFVKVKQLDQEKTNINEKHPGVVCDECNLEIKGIRYKCLACFDYDICSSCEAKGLHPDEHELLCIKKPRSSSSYFVMRPGFPGGAFRGRGGPGGCRGGPFGQQGGAFKGRGGAFGGRGGPFCGRGGPFGGQGRPSGRCGGSCGRQGGACNGKRPFGGEGKPWFGHGHWGCHGMGMFGNGADGHCFESADSNENKDSFKGNPCWGPDCKSQFEEILKNLATMFGFDPEVAFSQFNSIFKNCEEEHDNEKGNDESQQQFEKVLAHIAQSFGLDVEVLKQTAQSMLSNWFPVQENNECPQNDDNKETNSGEEKKTEETSGNEDVMETEVEHTTEEASGDAESQEMPLPQKSEDFIVVESKPAKENKPAEGSLTENQKYELRLGKAIRQMEAMGFDNDGGWLRQLLVSKDLSIGRVLDALNPSM
ncbi:uncharacterized protein LOC130645686 [Hydractinia symbiolongicarpus]|uniref:uncharacterized protein LOC130645686 n=1 Tax=Hydractinia symbiolongicarpus TaxID=13093 RepID=UPI00255168D3|nr:uncharacterized protein LOC130645686 [Hydractinia symbiolongicarpus]